MPPKASKKAEDKAKAKVIEDRTFGLKNKNKSTKVQKYVDSVTQQVKSSGTREAQKEKIAAEQRKKEKEAAEKAKQEVAALFRPVINQKIPPGVDPKSILCEAFRQGVCDKGFKCKFSHDLAVQRKSEKIDLYTDRRLTKEEKEKDSMESWDQDKLSSVVDQKQSAVNKQLKTAIVCKYFLDAIEQKKYGWFWECPNGGDKCMYQHCLPPGFVFQSKKKEEDVEDETPIEEIIEEERKKLTTRTPVTLETFKKWKEEKRMKKEQEAKAAEEKRLADIKAGKTSMSGREMFVFNPDLFVDDEGATDINIAELGDEGEDEGPSGENGDDGNENGDESEEDNGNDDEGSSTTTTTTSENVDGLSVEVEKSLFIDADDVDLPDEDD
eukprot:TRINITY_DN1395_c0_g4_i1.p1 TRINITY_DN1395_c0_g4~~TRINITY_DN1395_c0_g4_i1.p1  ORF type:complete len:382 (-),score=123.72 TRINITY_DN1395_c0_g4_i1:374-1519(-)